MAPRRILASLFLILGFSAFLVMPQPVFSQYSQAGKDALKFLDQTAIKGGLTDAEKSDTYDSETAVLKIIGNIINVLLAFVGILFFIQLFYAGFRWMTSGGNEEVVSESRHTIKTAVIGIVVIFSAFIITNFTLNQIGKITSTQQVSTQLGSCKYAETTDQCGSPHTWTGLRENISKAGCEDLVPSDCRADANSGWTPNP